MGTTQCSQYTVAEKMNELRNMEQNERDKACLEHIHGISYLEYFMKKMVSHNEAIATIKALSILISPDSFYKMLLYDDFNCNSRNSFLDSYINRFTLNRINKLSSNDVVEMIQTINEVSPQNIDKITAKTKIVGNSWLYTYVNVNPPIEDVVYVITSIDKINPKIIDELLEGKSKGGYNIFAAYMVENFSSANKMIKIRTEFIKIKPNLIDKILLQKYFNEKNAFSVYFHYHNTFDFFILMENSPELLTIKMQKKY